MSSEQTYGFHTPKLTTEFLKILNENSKIKFEDSSWKNDLTDSAYNTDKDIFVYFPNSVVTNNDTEEFSRFLVIYNRETMFKKTKELEFQTIDEVIQEINNNN